MSRILKHLLLLLIAFQLAAPVGCCCRVEGSGHSGIHSKHSAQSCGAKRPAADHAPSAPAKAPCCCPREATKAGPFEPPATGCEFPAIAGSVGVETGATSKRPERGIGRHDSRRRAWHLELCVWRC